MTDETCIVALVILGGLGLFILVLYTTIKTKSTSLETYEPFKEWVEKTVILNKETVLFKEKIPMNYNSDYPYILYDSLHPQWQYVKKNLPNRIWKRLLYFRLVPS